MAKKLFWIIICLFLCSPAAGARSEEVTLPPETVEFSNHIMLSMYQDILDERAYHPELKDFGEQSLFQNDQGVYTIIYDYHDEESGGSYSFGITINTIDALDFEGRQGRFNYGFPKLKIKISGFLQKHAMRNQYDTKELIAKYGMKIAQYQQQFMPLKIFIEPTKKTFKVREDIVFDVVLQNVSKRHMRVQSLGKDSLYFLINDQTWGTNPVDERSHGKAQILKSGKQFRIRFKGESFQKPQKVNITCFYGMIIDGVNPIGTKEIEIVE